MDRGIFIVLEGPDGAGTTKHTELLAARIARETGREVVQTAEPTNGPIGAMVRALLHGAERPQPAAAQLLFCADRAMHVAQVIEPALLRGAVVVCDRYTLSTIIYGTAQHLSSAWLASVNAPFPTPDCTILTLPPFAVCLERTDRRGKRDQYEQAAFQRGIYDAYAAVPQDERMHVVDTSGEKEDVAETVWRTVQPLLR